MIESSELIINSDGSIYHLHLLPEDIAEDIILVGDQARVKVVAANFDTIELEKSNREFFTITGTYKGKRLTVISTGIGTDNIDIVINELDALVNIDFKTREIKKNKKSLNFIRIGTSGGLQQEINAGDFVLSTNAVGFDSVLNYYKDVDTISDKNAVNKFLNQVNWNESLPKPYIVEASEKLIKLFNNKDFHFGYTISSPGFYGPQGRILRLDNFNKNINTQIQNFEYKNNKINNYEMECSAIYGLSALLGHNALTVCVIIANRVNKSFVNDYKPIVEKLIVKVLDKLVEL
jgi:uridine phosphorylase